MLFVTKHRHVLQMFTPHTRAMCRFVDVQCNIKRTIHNGSVPFLLRQAAFPRKKTREKELEVDTNQKEETSAF